MTGKRPRRRLAAILAAGAIVVSATVREHVRGKLEIGFDDLGPQQVKNIAEPVRAFRIRAGVAQAADPPALPDKPSIVVLPFANMSGDPEQEYFADGISEDIITALSRFNWFFVIARNSSFSYKGTSPDIRRVAEELGVQYVLEGSVRKGGNRVRVTAQLIDAATGHHVWAERYDRDLDDIFAVQDEITSEIAGAVAPSFVSAEARRVGRKQPDNLDAWERAVRGNNHLWRLGRDNLAEARRLFGEAVEMDANSTFALAGFALACSWQYFWGWADDPRENRELAYEAARKAIALDGDDAWAQAAFGVIVLHRREFSAALGAAKRALELNPNLPLAESTLALIHAWRNEYDEALVHSDRATRLSPRDPAKVWFILPRVIAAFVAGRREEQVEWARKITETTPDHPIGWRFLAAGAAELGQMEEARAALRQYLELVPHHTIETIRNSAAVTADYMEVLIAGLRKAGLPEE